MLRSASREDSIASSVDSWERFCREEARQAASSFLERVKRFKSRNAAARDVHDSTFTNEFSAAFLEESSVLMASGDVERSCPVNGQAQSRSFFSRSISTRSERSTFARNESKTSVKSGSSGSGGGGGKKTWWSQIFKWSKSKRRNNSSLNSSGEYGSRMNGGSSAQRRRVILDGSVQLLDLNETAGPLLWTPCKLVLAEAQGNFQVEIFIPPKSSVPKTTLFCFLIEDVRSTSALEIPESTTCFVIKSQNHGEHVFNAETEFKKQRWIQVLLDCKSQIIRSASAQTHLATLPRTPQRTPVRLPNGSACRHNNGVISLEASPHVHSQRYGVMSSYASSESSEQKKSTLNVGGESDGEDSAMMDVTSLIRRLNHASPSRRRKVQSMFVDSNLNSIYPTTATAASMNCTTSSSHYHPPPPLSHSPPNYEHDYLHQPPSLPARLPYTSLPTDPSSPPPLPKRNPPSRSGCGASFSSGHKLPLRNNNNSPSPHHLPAISSPNPVSSSATTPNTSAAAHSLPVTTRLATGAATNGSTNDGTTSGTTRALISPRRKCSQPLVDLPPPPSTTTAAAVPSSGTSLGNLEHCSQSSSSSALHPVSLAAVQRTMANNNGRRRSSITSNPGDVTQPMSLLNVQPSFQQKSEDRTRKMSAPVLMPEVPKMDESLQKRLMNGLSGQKSEQASADATIVEDVITTSNVDSSSSSSSTVRESDRVCDEDDTSKEQEQEQQQQEKCELQQTTTFTQGGACVSADSAISSAHAAQRQDHRVLLDHDDDYDETTSRKATFNFPYNASPHLSGGSTSSCSPPRRPSSPLLVHQRTAGSSSPRPVAEPITSMLSFQRQSQQDDHERTPDDDSGLMTGPLVAGSGPIVGNSRGAVGGGGGERRGHGGQRSQSQASNHTNPSTRTNSSSDEAESVHPSGVAIIEGRGRVPASAISNPIYVETTENGREGTTTSHQQSGEPHTQHPYEHWATNQQDVANLRLLSQYPWFHGMVSRANASQLVLTSGESGTGQYLVRQSESREGDFVLTFNYHNRAKHLRMAVDDGGCNIQHLWFEDVPNMLDYFKANSIPLESFWLNDDVKLTTYIDRRASDSFRTTTVVNMDRIARVPPRRSRSLHLGMANSVNTASNNASNPGTPVPLDANGSSASSSNSQSTNSLPQSARNSTGWRLFRSQRSSSAGNVGRIQRRHSANVGSLLSTGSNSHRSSGRRRRNNNNNENAYIVRNY